MRLMLWKTAIFCKKSQFSFKKWKPLILETWVLSHSLVNFIDLNVFLNHFFVKILRFIDIQHFYDRKLFIVSKNCSFSFIKWKPLIIETWFLSHSPGEFVSLNVYLDHFFDESLRFIDIQHFSWHHWGFGSYLVRKCRISINLRVLSKSDPSKRSSQ